MRNGFLSPEAEKAQQDGAARASDWRPTVARISDKAIVIRARKSGGRSGFVAWMAANLPTFTHNSRQDRWEGPLDDLGTAVEALRYCNLSDGARQWLAEHKDLLTLALEQAARWQIGQPQTWLVPDVAYLAQEDHGIRTLVLHLVGHDSPLEIATPDYCTGQWIPARGLRQAYREWVAGVPPVEAGRVRL